MSKLDILVRNFCFINFSPCMLRKFPRQRFLTQLTNHVHVNHVNCQLSINQTNEPIRVDVNNQSAPFVHNNGSKVCVVNTIEDL